MRAHYGMTFDGSCWSRWCMRCRWNKVTGQTKRRRQATFARFAEYKAIVDACDHQYQPHSMWAGWQSCANRCGTFRRVRSQSR